MVLEAVPLKHRFLVDVDINRTIARGKVKSIILLCVKHDRLTAQVRKLAIVIFHDSNKFQLPRSNVKTSLEGCLITTPFFSAGHASLYGCWNSLEEGVGGGDWKRVLNRIQSKIVIEICLKDGSKQ